MNYQNVDGHIPYINDYSKLAALEGCSIVALDTETNGLSPWRNQTEIIQLYGAEAGVACIFHTPGGSIDHRLAAFIQNFNGTFVGHNLVGFDAHFLANQGCPIDRKKLYDTMVGEATLKTQDRRDIRINLKAAIARRLGVEILKDVDHGNWGALELTQEQVYYALRDVILLPHLMTVQKSLAAERGMTRALELETDLIPVVIAMTANGLPFNTNIWGAYMAGNEERMAKALESLNEMFPGKVSNWGSHVQIKKLSAAENLDLKNTQAPYLEQAQHFHKNPVTREFVTRLLNYKKEKKFIEMYTREWVAKYVIDGIVHPRFWQMGTDTGRFSSSEPNILQIPKKRRDMFGYGPDSHLRIVNADYSQLEVRIAADIAGDDRFKAACVSGDVHRSVAADTLGIPFSEVTPDQRQKGKAQVFRLLFGGGAKSLRDAMRAQGVDMSHYEAQQVVNKFFHTYPGLAQARYTAFAMAGSRNVLKINLPYGYQRVLVGSKLSGPTILNTTVQGTAGVGIKLVLRELLGTFRHQLSVAIYDEVVLTAVPKDLAEEVLEAVSKTMKQCMESIVDVPIEVEGRTGLRWAS